MKLNPVDSAIENLLTANYFSVDLRVLRQVRSNRLGNIYFGILYQVEEDIERDL